MEVPKFLIADNSTLEEEIFVLHMEYPRFLLNVSNDDILWLELSKVTESLIDEALTFFDSEIENLQ
jgi:hypothetical protein